MLDTRQLIVYSPESIETYLPQTRKILFHYRNRKKHAVISRVPVVDHRNPTHIIKKKLSTGTIKYSPKNWRTLNLFQKIKNGLEPYFGVDVLPRLTSGLVFYWVQGYSVYYLCGHEKTWIQEEGVEKFQIPWQILYCGQCLKILKKVHKRI